MINILKAIRQVLNLILIVIISLTLYFILDRYVFSQSLKGISPVDIKNVCAYLILPLTFAIIVILFIEKRIKTETRKLLIYKEKLQLKLSKYDN